MNNFGFRPESKRAVVAAQKRATPKSGLAVPPTPPTPPAPPEVSHDDIARRAYDIYIKKGRQQGQSQQNWRQAEAELRKEAVAAGLGKLSETPPATHVSLEPPVKTIASAASSFLGGKSSTGGPTNPLPSGGRNAKN